MTYYISHHGIEGQKWGVQNGPPYPLDYNDHTAAEKKHMKKDASRLTNRLNSADQARAMATRDYKVIDRKLTKRQAQIKKIQDKKAASSGGSNSKWDRKLEKLKDKEKIEKTKKDVAYKNLKKTTDTIDALLKEVGDKGYYSSAVLTQRNVVKGKDLVLNMAAVLVQDLVGSPVAFYYVPSELGVNYKIKAGNVKTKKAKALQKAESEIESQRTHNQISDKDIGRTTKPQTERQVLRDLERSRDSMSEEEQELLDELIRDSKKK